MKKIDYFKYAITTDNLCKLPWYYSFFIIITDKFTNNEFLRVNNKVYEVNVNNKWEVLEDVDSNPIFHFKDPVTLSTMELPNIKTAIKTTIGRGIFNKVLLTRNFSNKIDYINDKTNIATVENIIANKLKNDEVTVTEYLKFTDAVGFMHGLSRITNISATYKNVLPPPNIEKIKKGLEVKFAKQYGSNWYKDPVKVVEFEKVLKAVDEEWLKDDPSNNKLINKKIKDDARSKMYLTFGQTTGLSGETTFVNKSLLEGAPSTAKEIAAEFNSSRAGSYDRGHNTQRGGATSKILLRAISNYTIIEGDCGSKLGKDLTVTKDIAGSLTGRYMIINNKPVKIEDGNKLIGKDISIRSPMYCKTAGPKYCRICTGENMFLYPKGIALNILNISDVILSANMKKMHTSTMKTLEVDINDMIS